MNSNRYQTFDPFESRLCRNVRNDLGQCFLNSIPAGKMEPIHKAARMAVPADADPVIKRYVHARVERYRSVFSAIGSAGTEAADTWFIACLLWNEALFFECHEWLEKKWRRSEDAEKKMVQALIWAAGAYSHLEYGRGESAGKLAARAVGNLTLYREQVPAPFDADLLVAKLKALDPVPPQFNPAP